MYLYGANGHAKVIIDILRANNIEVKALVDDNPAVEELMGLPVRHTAEGCTPLLISIGDNLARWRVVQRLQGMAAFGKAVHPSAVVSPAALIEDGTVVMQGAVVQACAHIGRHCIVNTGATVDHDVVVGDFAHISPGVSLCGNVQVGQGTQIGVGSVVVPGVRIGKWSLVCAGSVVTKDIPDFCVAGGNRCEVLRFKDMKVFENQDYKLMGGGNSLIINNLSLRYCATMQWAA